jgi:ATP-dependent DNA ligase
LAPLLNGASECLRYNDHQIGQGPAFHRLACEHDVEGIVSKRANGRYEPNRRTRLKIKCLNREEFVVVGWSDPERGRHRIGSLLLGYFTPGGSSSRQAVPAPVCSSPNWNAFGSASSPRSWRRCRSQYRRHVVPGSDHRWCSAGSIGSGPKSSSKSLMRNGRLTVC